MLILICIWPSSRSVTSWLAGRLSFTRFMGLKFSFWRPFLKLVTETVVGSEKKMLNSYCMSDEDINKNTIEFPWINLKILNLWVKDKLSDTKIRRKSTWITECHLFLPLDLKLHLRNGKLVEIPFSHPQWLLNSDSFPGNWIVLTALPTVRNRQPGSKSHWPLILQESKEKPYPLSKKEDTRGFGKGYGCINTTFNWMYIL